MSDPTQVFQQGTTPPTPSGLRPPVPPQQNPLAAKPVAPVAPAMPQPMAPFTPPPLSPVAPTTGPRPIVPPPAPAFGSVVSTTAPRSVASAAVPAPGASQFRIIPQAPMKPAVQPQTITPMTTNPAAANAHATPPKSPAAPAVMAPAKPFGAKSDIQEKPGATLAHAHDVQKSPFRFLPFILGALVLILGGWFAFTRFFGGGAKPSTPTTNTQNGTTPAATTPATKTTTLTWWGLWEPSPVLDEVLRAFEAQNPGVKVSYVQESPKDYRERLQDALKKGEGPDVFRFHNSWVPMLRTSMSVMPATIMTPEVYATTFYPVATKDFRTSEGIVGIPLMYDSLALYYNKAIFTTAGKTVPKTWNDLDALATALTVRDTAGKIQRAGIALGTTSNVDHYPEILTLLLLQNGADPSNLTSPLAAQAFKYYTDFAKVKKVWDATLPNSTYAFATEKSAMMLAPSWRAFDIKSINPNLDFGIAQAPQLPGTDITVATYWAEGVSKTSKQQALAWKLLQYLSTKETLQKLSSSAATKTPRLFGEIYPRPDMASLLSADPYTGAFVADAPKATSWYMNSRTADNGINDKIIKYVEDAVNAIILNGTATTDALTTASQGITQVLQQYGIPVTSGTAGTTP